MPLRSAKNVWPQKRELIRSAHECTLCARMSQSRKVLSDLNGSWTADVMFVAEAPGRLGAEKTGIPLFGDRTGDRFDELLAAMHFERSHVFISNAVLCNPRDDRGNNATPSRAELFNCSHHLRKTIDIISPKVVVALGRIALEALAAVCSHNLELRSAIRGVYPWFDRYLGVLYHPGPRSAVHRPWKLQISDAKVLGRNVRDLI